LGRRSRSNWKGNRDVGCSRAIVTEDGTWGDAITMKQVDVGRWITMETLSFIKGDMARMLDSFGVEIIVIRMPECVLETEEDTLAGSNVELGLTGRRKSKDATTEDAEEPKVRPFTRADGNRRKLSITSGDAVGEQDEMFEGIWPELGREACSMEHGTNAVSNDAMRTFNLANFIGGVGSGDRDVVTGIFEEIMHVGGTAEFTTTVEADRTVTRVSGIAGDPLTEEVEGRFLITTDGELPSTALAVRNKDVTCLTVET